ncbi:bifunctional adenosylcobinamide kinase/adenosylcobinamide-phosphate guanylyltransferase [Sphingomonas sp. ACRSK]|uniref:bifunctional adenosylcobinamide kinase/adenosylcobinamide-phosphate guanylyltransferase n=1 Tax=Sphingomonas sp. ACRSK TaxID=2918213 RepID=UPI001EF53A93|nr:bifunctional adenosylcobinamide kinase/adenosylcobinamide-phosphate guanylyltransferase [Sphingomonas sp. ACRSK]MCG7347040.1 bifunctional adenosylcobinamide kinase/adenosylcobinamide-phosphate guanylyltransferase [Sphingomonas sp. ACRSK]
MSIERSGRTMLVLGGARSGKSRYAQSLAEASGGRLVFVATAQAFDDEMTDRIRRHQADRDGRWTTVEASVDLASAIAAADDEDAVVLVDCLTLWASNLLLGEEDAEARLAQLLAALERARGQVLLVANEVGLGIVPDNALARAFRDLAGTVNQRVAAVADQVHMTVAGIPIIVK